MPSAHETAYPRLKSNPSPSELAAVYTPTREETALAGRIARGEVAGLGFLVLLKVFQRLGYFLQLRDVPPVIVEHIAHTQGFLVAPGGLGEYDESGTRRRHVAVIRAHQRVKPFDTGGQVALGKAVREAAQAKEDLTDIINVAIEELVRQAFELPGFTTIQEAAQRGRAEVNRGFYAQVFDSLGEDGRKRINRLNERSVFSVVSFMPVRSKYSNVLKPWVMSSTPRTALGKRYTSNVDRVTLCHVRFGMLFSG